MLAGKFDGRDYFHVTDVRKTKKRRSDVNVTGASKQKDNCYSVKEDNGKFCVMLNEVSVLKDVELIQVSVHNTEQEADKEAWRLTLNLHNKEKDIIKEAINRIKENNRC